MSIVFKSIFSPTWFFARVYKEGKYSDIRKKRIQQLNITYLIISVITIVAVIVYQAQWELPIGTPVTSLANDVTFGYKFFWFYFLISRCNEIFMAFLMDASDKLKSNRGVSSLQFFERLNLSLKSYLELIINFALLYMLTPLRYWCKENPFSVFDALFYSASTITTLSDSSVSPVFWFVKLLTIYQIFCGFSLLIVCFTVYTGRAISEIGTTNNISQNNINTSTFQITVKENTSDED